MLGKQLSFSDNLSTKLTLVDGSELESDPCAALAEHAQLSVTGLVAIIVSLIRSCNPLQSNMMLRLHAP